MQRPTTPSFDTSSFWTPLVRNVMLTLFGLYVVELVIGWQRCLPWLALFPPGQGLLPWQPLTFSFMGGDPRSMLWQFVGVFFFLQQVVDAMGARRFWLSTLFAWGFALCFKLGAELAGVLAPAPALGFGWWVDAMVCWFGLLHRDAQVRMMFVLPVRAEILAWGSGLLSLLYLLFSRDTASLHMFAAWLGAFLVLRLDPGIFRRLRLRWKKRQIERELGRFEVIEGGKGERPRRSDPKDWVN
jgi:membrane associated rhomboid family serine protease